MIKNLRIRAKLALLAGIMLLAMLVLGSAGLRGIGTVTAGVVEVGQVRLPSIHGLLVLNEAQTAIAAATLRTAFMENDSAAQAGLIAVKKARAAAWANAQAGLKQYEPLPQTAEEALMWKAFEASWARWKAADDEMGKTIDAMAANADAARQKELFAKFYGQFAAAEPLFKAAESDLDKVTDLNDKIATDAVGDSVGAAAQARLLTFITILVALVLAVASAWWISAAIATPITAAVTVAQTIASGDLTSRIVADSRDETGQLLTALAAMNASLFNVVGEVRAGTEAIVSASTQIASGNLDLSSRTEEQASSLEETASSMEEMTSTVRQNAEHAQQVNRLARTAADMATQGGTVVARVVDTMDSISAASSEMAAIISVIDGIAFQTNILALNAAVEAARAGEQGRGFAVVASEVRNLAQRSATAAKEIKTLIDGSVQKVAAGTRLVDEAGITMKDVVSSVQRVSEIIADIDAATQEQSAGIDQINMAISQMDDVTQQNAALVEEAAAAAAALQDQAAGLLDVVQVFRLDAGTAVGQKKRAASRPAALSLALA